MDDAKYIVDPLITAQNQDSENQANDETCSATNEKMDNESQSIVQELAQEKSNLSIHEPDNEPQTVSQALREEMRRRSEFRDWFEYVAIKDVADEWISDNRIPEKYSDYMKEFFDKGIIHKTFADGKAFDVGAFRQIRHQAAIGYIKNLNDFPEEAREEMCACYSAFIGFLNDITDGWFIRALRDARDYKIAPDAVKQTLSMQEWRYFIDVLCEINPRDELIARLIIQGTVRITEALSLTIEQIDFLQNTICFKQKDKEVCIGYDADFIKELKEYINSTVSQRKGSSLVFVTRNGKPVTRSRLNYSFNQASQQAEIKKVSPESLRSTWTILKQQGWSDIAIMESKKARVRKGKGME